MSDPFIRTILQASLDAAAEEMFEVLRKTAMSPIIYEVLDVGTGITDAHGALVSSGAGIPSFVGVLDKSVQAILARFGASIAEGDVFITNDPNFGGVTHLNDIVLAEPVFFDGVCVAWAASIAHWGDIGGKTPGSMPVDVTEIIAEGLRLPMVRLATGGMINQSVFEIIRTNSRLPDAVTGDLWAQIAAARRAKTLIQTMCERHGAAAVEDAISEARTEGTKRARQGLADLPKGVFRMEAPQDDGALWCVEIEISRERFRVDLTKAPDQTSGPFNTSRDGAVIACQMIFKALTDPERFANAGSFAPLEVLTRPGSIFHSDELAPHGYYFETRIRLFDLLWQCLAQAMPDRLPAGHFASIFGTVIAGAHPETGRRFAMVEPQMGGWGATLGRPGMDAMYSTSHGDTFNCPVEIAEARYGLVVKEKSLGPAPENPSGLPGGRGVRTHYALRAPAVLSAGLSHAEIPVWSHAGGSGGGRNKLNVLRSSGHVEHHRFVSGLVLNPGDQVLIETAAGGGAPHGKT